MDLSILPHDDEGHITMTLFNAIISDDDFADKFAGSKLTHDSLTSHPAATPAWVQQFNAWRDEGILS